MFKKICVIAVSALILCVFVSCKTSSKNNKPTAEPEEEYYCPSTPEEYYGASKK